MVSCELAWLGSTVWPPAHAKVDFVTWLELGVPFGQALKWKPDQTKMRVSNSHPLSPALIRSHPLSPALIRSHTAHIRTRLGSRRIPCNAEHVQDWRECTRAHELLWLTWVASHARSYTLVPFHAIHEKFVLGLILVVWFNIGTDFNAFTPEFK